MTSDWSSLYQPSILLLYNISELVNSSIQILSSNYCRQLEHRDIENVKGIETGGSFTDVLIYRHTGNKVGVGIFKRI